MSMTEWAKREVEIACKKERGNAPEEEWDYGCACYDSAFRAFLSLCGDGHSGLSISFTKNILNRLIDGKPLTPIEDVPEVWVRCPDHYDEDDDRLETWQCSRMSSLFKTVYKDGTIKYSSSEQCYCCDINTGATFISGLSSDIIEELYPITMPYMPGESIKVMTEEFLTDTKNGDFDTYGIFYAIVNGEKVEINRYFADPNDYPWKRHAYRRWVEISKKEYEERKKKADILRERRINE